MLLGKRPRHPMRRTTSMTEFAADVEAPQPSEQERPQHKERQQQAVAQRRYGGVGQGWLDARHVAAGAASMRDRRRNSGDFAAVETAPFLRACGLCKRRLGPGRDTFMYRGEIAFCSLECRQQQMNLDERKEKCSLTSMKDSPPANGSSEQSSNGETVAAA
ncbi:FCS-Like Zinc finger 5-like [Typha angustifolia]|uniref:FCS-Like Zinc finger 5-like n=1 Tax=Typha angustifolia TaxID=59011 RepID=UPI003C2F1934